MAPIVSTSAITFRFEDEDFKILLEVALNNGKVISVSDSTQAFFNYLQDLHLVSSTENIYTWLDSSENVTLQFLSNFRNSYRIRKKAEILGLKVLPGMAFQKRRQDSLIKLKAPRITTK